MRWVSLALSLMVACTPVDEPAERPVEDLATIYDGLVSPNLTDDEVLGALLSGAEIETFDLEVSSDDVLSLLANPEEWVPADFTWRGRTFHQVGIRVKGNGSFRPFYDKPSLKIEFDKFVDGQDFFGLDTLVLNNMVSDDSKIRERTAYALYRAAGVPAPRAGSSVLNINGNLRGVYTHMEDVDDRMLAHWFEASNGPMFELFDVVLRDEDIPLFEHESGPDDRTLLYGAADALEAPSREEQMYAVRSYVDYQAFVRYYAVSGYLGQFDAWPFNDPSDDVHLYADPDSGRLHVIPHGLDESLSDMNRNVAIPGNSLLGQACYFTSCREDLRYTMWQVHTVAQEIDLWSQVRSFSDQLSELDIGADPIALAETEAAVLAVQELLADRPGQITTNLGPP